jgi:hypothetical protein
VRDRAGNVGECPVKPDATTLEAVPPTFPNDDPGLVATSPQPGRAQLTWTAASDNRSAASAISYLLYKSQDSGQLFAATTTALPAGLTTATVTGLLGGTWFFAVRAKDEAGNIETNTVTASVAVAAPPPTWTDVSTQVFGPAGCYGCHGTSEFAYATLLSAGNTNCGAKKMVVAGHPESSFLYEKVQPNPCLGSQMPQGGALTATQLNLVRDWILAGALEN